DGAQVARTLARRDAVAHGRVEGHEAGRVVLQASQVRQARGGETAVFQLGDLAAVAERHGAGPVEQQVAAEGGLFFVLLDVELVAPPQHAPVDVPRVHAGRVLAVFGELDREAALRAAVHAGKVALD